MRLARVLEKPSVASVVQQRLTTRNSNITQKSTFLTTGPVLVSMIYVESDSCPVKEKKNKKRST